MPEAWRDALTTWADPFVVGFLFPMMSVGGDVEICGPTSPSLLANLEAFNAIWSTWEPGVYRPVRLWSPDEREPPPPAEPDVRIMPFSGGVDSSLVAALAADGTSRFPASITVTGVSAPVS